MIAACPQPFRCFHGLPYCNDQLGMLCRHVAMVVIGIGQVKRRDQPAMNMFVAKR